ncbi:MAG: FHA domain-containing protein [Alphaproteobacteria bacterium]|jgi:hypothetical protein|nr:FHA domain-containing protein [Alphaproteobacteria bacterium]MBP9877069.1 FHA domain-containing protein [Alphaproteobacteria bacterium]
MSPDEEDETISNDDQDISTDEVSSPVSTDEMGNGNVMLKIFSGPHNGGEFDLDDAEYTIGQDEDCDIVFSDQSLSGKHAKLTIHDGEFVISPLNGSVYLSGELLGPGDHIIPSYEMVTMGGTNFAFGYSKDQWPKLTIPLINKMLDDHNDLQNDHPQTETLAENRDESNRPDAPIDGSRESIFQTGRWRESYSKVKTQFTEKPLMALGISLVSILFLSGIFYAIFTMMSPSKPSIIDLEKTYIQRANKIIEEQGLKDHVFASGPFDNYIIVKGYVTTQAQKDNLLGAFQAEGISVDPQLYVISVIEESARVVLSALGYDLKVKMIEDGVLKIQGVVDTEGPLMDKLVSLKNDVAGIERIDDQIIAMDTLGSTLHQIANKYNLLDHLSFAILGRQINVTGSIPEALSDPYDKMITAVKAILYDEFQVLAQVKITSNPNQLDTAEKKTFELLNQNLSGVVLGNAPYLVFNDTTHYPLKSKLPDGAEIKVINQNEIIFVKDDEETPYPYRKVAQWVLEKAETKTRIPTTKPSTSQKTKP